MARVNYDKYSLSVSKSLDGIAGELRLFVWAHGRGRRSKCVYILAERNGWIIELKSAPKTMGITERFKMCMSVYEELPKILESAGWAKEYWATTRKVMRFFVLKGYVQECGWCDKKRARVMKRKTPYGHVCSRECERMANKSEIPF